MFRKTTAVVGLLLSSLISACSLAPVSPEFSSSGARCLALFEAVDQRIDQAGLLDAGEHRIAGFPWARSTRFLASFADQLTPQSQDEWLHQLRRTDQAARHIELENLAARDSEITLQKLAECGQQLLRETLASPAAMAALRSAVKVPDDYSLLARGLGLYPLALPFLKAGVAGYQAEVLQSYKQPLSAPQGEWASWQLATPISDAKTQKVTLADVPRNSLGIAQLSKSQTQALLAQHAPAFLIDQNGEFDRPGMPLAQQGKTSPEFDPSRPKLYQKLTWTRFHGQVLPQLVYLVWFSQRPAESAVDFYAGQLDGVMWRVTLDSNGEVLMHDTVHACGCYHYYFPAQHRARIPQLDSAQERRLFPQGQVPWQEVAVVLESGTHYVLRVVSLSEAKLRARGPENSLVAADYDELRRIPSESDSKRLFDQDGLVSGSQRLERFWLWPSGVRSPGAMRQWGRHATAFIGRAHFDDPFWLEAIWPPN